MIVKDTPNLVISRPHFCYLGAIICESVLLPHGCGFLYTFFFSFFWGGGMIGHWTARYICVGAGN